MSFHKNLGTDVPKQYIETKNDMSYISWATLIGLAGRPNQSVVFFGGAPGMSIFGGVAVAVDMKVGERMQRTWLPVLDNKNQPVPGQKVTARFLNDTINRCRAKAIAMVCGNALSMYAGYGGDGEKFSKDLTLKPTSNPAEVKAIASKKGSIAYLDWASALAAARITDPGFLWEVVEYPFTNQDSGEIETRPYLAAAGGYMVGIKVSWLDSEHTELLPIMDGGSRPIVNPNVGDWNKTVMRGLAKAIAVRTGYGLSLYAGEDLTGADGSSGEATSADNDEARKSKVLEVEALLTDADRSVDQLVKWLGHPGKKVVELPEEALNRALATLKTAA